jgi:GTP-binding protein
MFLYHKITARLPPRIFIVNISSAIFDRSSPSLDLCPDESLPEFAFIGRSNVGKSSLLNMLAGQSGLAKVSPVPGHTKLLNFFTMNRNWRLVDLPGYGYAKVARVDKSKFNQAVLDYLENRPNLCCVFALIDSNLTPQAIDVEFIEWLAHHQIPFVFVFTKVDRVSDKTIQDNIAAFKERVSKGFVQLPAILTSSATTGDGRTELLAVVDETLSAIKAEAKKSRASSDDLQAPAAAPRKNRPDRARPW